MACSFNNRVQGTGFSVTPLVGAIGGAYRYIAPIFLPTVVGLGTEWVFSKLVPSSNQSTTPSPLAPTVEESRNTQREAKISLGVGVVVVAGLALYLLTKRR